MNDSFDLDLALTMEDHNANTDRSITVNIKNSEHLSPDEARDKVSGMPTVVLALGVCTVCMETLNSSSKKAPCGHLFHAFCITQWLCYHNSCPICRFKVSDHLKKAPACGKHSSHGV